MRRNAIIRKFSAGCLMLLFAFCVTPKKIWHDLVANHQDSGLANIGQSQFLHAGYHCHFEDLVVNAPFLAQVSPIEIVVFRSVESFTIIPISETVHKFCLVQCLRGPPAVC